MNTKTLVEFLKWGVLSAIVAVAVPDMAWAATDINSLVTDVTKKQLPVLPYALGAVCYVAGSFMLVSGAFELKKHAENPNGHPMSKGVARLLTGGAITSVPALTGIIQGSTELGTSSKATFTAFTQTF